MTHNNQSELEHEIKKALIDYGYALTVSGGELKPIVDELEAYITANYTPNSEVERLVCEAREKIGKLYESELEMHRKFMDSVIANNQLKTTAMYCIKCGAELFNIKEQTND